MMDQSVFAKAINDNPYDINNLLIFADWLEEQCDIKATYYRWLVIENKFPEHEPAEDYFSEGWLWWSSFKEYKIEHEETATLPLKPPPQTTDEEPRLDGTWLAFHYSPFEAYESAYLEWIKPEYDNLRIVPQQQAER